MVDKVGTRKIQHKNSNVLYIGNKKSTKKYLLIKL